jgi:hypothetical protein
MRENEIKKMTVQKVENKNRKDMIKTDRSKDGSKEGMAQNRKKRGRQGKKEEINKES